MVFVQIIKAIYSLLIYFILFIHFLKNYFMGDFQNHMVKDWGGPGVGGGGVGCRS